MIDAEGENSTNGISESGFLTLMRLFILRDRPETVWTVLKAMQYDDSLHLSIPQISIFPSIHYELSVECRQFLLQVRSLYRSHFRSFELMIVIMTVLSHPQS